MQKKFKNSQKSANFFKKSQKSAKIFKKSTKFLQNFFKNPQIPLQFIPRNPNRHQFYITISVQLISIDGHLSDIFLNYVRVHHLKGSFI